MNVNNEYNSLEILGAFLVSSLSYYDVPENLQSLLGDALNLVNNDKELDKIQFDLWVENGKRDLVFEESLWED